MCKVTVIIPTYNRGALLISAVESVVSQTFTDMEILIIDDGSTDSTPSIIKNFTDARIKYISQLNSGQAAARNTGIRNSQGEYIAFLDDDDIWFPNKVELQVAILDKKPDIGMVFGGWVDIDEESHPLKEFRPWLWMPDINLKSLIWSCPIMPSGVMVRRRWLELGGYFDEQITKLHYGGEDWDLWLRLVYYGCEITWVKELVFGYRIHFSSWIHNTGMQNKGLFLVLDKFFKNPDLPCDIREIRNSVYADGYLRMAAREYGAGEVDIAKQNVADAIILDPNLLANNCNQIYQSIIGWVGDPVVADPVNYVKNVFENMPEQAQSIRVNKHKATAYASKVSIFNKRFQNKRAGITRDLALIVQNDPIQLIDRGIFSLICELILGPKNYSVSKNILKKIIRIN